MNYAEIFTSSGRLVWNRRVLWLIGMMAAFFGQGGYGFSANYNQSMPTSAGGTPGLPPGMERLATDIMQNAGLYIALGVTLSLLWALVALFLGWLALGAMISIAGQEETDWQAAFSQSRSRLGSLVLVAIVLALPMLVLLLIGVGIALALIVPLFTTSLASEGAPEDFLPRIFGALACMIPLIGVGILLGILLRGINIFAARACVLENLGVGASIRRGWQLLRKNIGYSMLNGLVLFAIGIAFGIVAAIPALGLLFMSAPSVFEGRWDTQVMLGIVGLIVYSLLMNVGVSGILTSFAETTWTKLYQAFVEQTDTPVSGSVIVT